MKLEGHLPVPSLTATLPMLPDSAPRNTLRDVVIAGMARIAPVARRDAHHCSRCKALGLEAKGHNSASSLCPSRPAP